MNIKNYLIPTKKYKILTSSLHSVYRLVNSTYVLRDLVTRLTRLICQILDVQYCMILLCDPTRKFSTLRCLASGKKRYIVDKNTRISDPLHRRIINKASTIRKQRVMGLPLVCEDVIGMVIVKRTKDKPAFDKFSHEIFATIAEQSIVGIRNLQLYEEHQRIVLGSIKALATLLDKRIPRGYTHSPGFSHLVVAIGRQMHLDSKRIESLKYASLLHDAGKVDIPYKILTKTTKLTPSEYDIIRKHPVKGAQILRPMQILKPVVPIIMHQHEKYDGTGYPSRLKKGQIPLGARIMAVADTFEAMVYGRPYRERKDMDSAIREIQSKSGSQFDPKVVEAFLKVVKGVFRKKYLKLDAV
ncbi:HD-GYP domain-containing protein [Candidatus Omnitrophota bacterium]